MNEKITKAQVDAAIDVLWKFKRQLLAEVQMVEGLVGKVEGLQASLRSDLTVENLDISVRAYQVLKSYIYQHMGSQPENHALRYIDERELVAFPGAGRRVVREIKKELARYGIPLRNPLQQP